MLLDEDTIVYDGLYVDLSREQVKMYPQIGYERLFIHCQTLVYQ